MYHIVAITLAVSHMKRIITISIMIIWPYTINNYNLWRRI